MTELVRSLRSWRMEQALGCKELAQRAGVSPQTIRRIERGQSRSRPHVFRKIAAALGVAPLHIAEYHRLVARELWRGR